MRALMMLFLLGCGALGGCAGQAATTDGAGTSARLSSDDEAASDGDPGSGDYGSANRDDPGSCSMDGLRGRGIGVDTAIDIVRSGENGRLLDVYTHMYAGRCCYVVRWAQVGLEMMSRRDYYVDAMTGEIWDIEA